jgi:hypothetical protein
MSERLETTAVNATGETGEAEPWATGEHYSRMKIDAGALGNVFYYSLPAFTVLAHTRDELDGINEDFSALLSKYTDGIIVGSSHEASLVLSLNQAAADLKVNGEIIDVLRSELIEIKGEPPVQEDSES